MAISRKGEDCFTYFIHTEDGQVTPRRIHQLEIRDGKGSRPRILTGADLPDFISVSTGKGFKGKHLGRILLNSDPNESKTKWKVGAEDIRDIFFFISGFSSFYLLSAIAQRLGG